MKNEHNLRTEMVQLGKKLYGRELLVATEGNFSVRLDDERLLATPSGLCKGDMTEEDLVIIDLRGNHLTGERRVSSEIKMHLEVYRQRRDVQAVIHAHPPMCIAMMLAGKALDRPILAEVVLILGKVPIAPYATPSTNEIPESIMPLIPQTDCILLDHHGSLTAGRSLSEACYKLELLEQTAKTYLTALQVSDTVRELPPEKVAELMQLRESRYGITWPIIPF